jgi:alkanesulfonate monooxygenase SsuD/methylene tetrahydromethanopterin reductase-like flavin-dependent oxidoreductase (luciferase family)
VRRLAKRVAGILQIDNAMYLSALNIASPPDAVCELAKLCDSLPCYRRFWIGEHHDGYGVPDPLSVAMIAATVTQRIRLGTGAVSLTFRNPELVAETALLAELFFPNRIDLGVGRTLAQPDAVRRLLAGLDLAWVHDDYDARLRHVRRILMREDDSPVALLQNVVTRGPNMFLMGTTVERAKTAGDLGVGLAASFHHGGCTVPIIQQMLHAYRTTFRPSVHFAAPYAIVAVSGYVSDDQAALSDWRDKFDEVCRTLMMPSPSATPSLGETPMDGSPAPMTVNGPAAPAVDPAERASAAASEGRAEMADAGQSQTGTSQALTVRKDPPPVVTVFEGSREAAVRLRQLGEMVGADEMMFLPIASDSADCYRSLASGWAATDPVSLASVRVSQKTTRKPARRNATRNRAA